MWRQRSESKTLAVTRDGGACCATAGRTASAKAMDAAAARGAMRMESSGLYCGTPEGSAGIASRGDLLLLSVFPRHDIFREATVDSPTPTPSRSHHETLAPRPVGGFSDGSLDLGLWPGSRLRGPPGQGHRGDREVHPDRDQADRRAGVALRRGGQPALLRGDSGLERET